jgi:hypothetical protein
MNELMKQQKQLKLMCYKMEIAMSVEAWYFLYGTTCGTCNLFYFFSLLSRMATEDTTCNKRGMAYIIHPGQADGSMLSLAREWSIGRKAVSRLLEDFCKRGLIRVASNPVTSVIDIVSVKSWMKDGRVTENPTYVLTVKAYEGVRIYLSNGQRLELLRKSSAIRKKQQKDKAEIALSHAELPNRTEPTEQPVLEDKGLMAEHGNPTESPAVQPQTNTNGDMVRPEDSPSTMPSERTLFDGNPSYI